MHQQAHVAVREREIECPLHLTAKLLCFSLCLPVRRPAARIRFVQSFNELCIHEL